MTYTTQQLIQILDQELRANWKGERIVLSSEKRFDDPVIAKALDARKLSKVFAYQDFRRQIHQYQQECGVSGIIWRISRFQGKQIYFPEVHNQLIAIPGDKEILIAAKAEILDFWWKVTENFQFWLASDRHCPISIDSVMQFAQKAEWAEIDAAQTEVYLGLCWGDPQEYQYQWSFPTSGCYRIIAAISEPSAIKV